MAINKLYYAFRITLFAIFLILPLSSFAQFPSKLSEKLRDSLIQVADEIQDVETRVAAYNALSLDFRNQSSFKSIEYGEKAYALKDQVSDSSSVEILSTIVIPKINNGRLEESLEILKEAEIKARKLADPSMLSLVLLQNGFCRQRMAMYKLAVEYYLESLRIRTNLRDTSGMLNLYNRIGVVYKHQKNYEKALESLYKITENEAYVEDKVYGAACENVAKIYVIQNRRESAIMYLKKALKWRSRNNTIRNKSYYYYDIGIIKNLENDYESAQLMLDTAFNFFQQAKLFVDRGEVKKMKGEIALQQNEIPKAIAEFKEALHFAELAKEIQTQAGTYKSLAKCYELAGNPSKAILAMNNYVTLNDSLTSFNISQLIAEYDIITKQEENNIAQEKAAFESQKAKSRANNLILISGLLLTIIGLLYLRNRSNKQANDILQSKNSIIEKSLSDKEILLKEIHHRVKNNLQIVSSMLNLQTRHINDPQVLEAITDSRNRVKSMALIHQNLYRQNNLKSIYISTYLHNLCASLFHSFKVDENRIKLTSNIEALELDVDTIIPIGLIVNELITNAIKYAFPDNRHGEIELNVKLQKDYLFLQVKDNGIGLNPDFDYKKSDSFGYSLIHSLAGKLKAKISIISNDGTNAEFQIKNFKLISDEVS